MSEKKIAATTTIRSQPILDLIDSVTGIESQLRAFKISPLIPSTADAKERKSFASSNCVPSDGLKIDPNLKFKDSPSSFTAKSSDGAPDLMIAIGTYLRNLLLSYKQ